MSLGITIMSNSPALTPLASAASLHTPSLYELSFREHHLAEARFPRRTLLVFSVNKGKRRAGVAIRIPARHM